MQKNGAFVLWLPSWYPNHTEPLNGDFIQRHARAVASQLPVKVIYVLRDGEGLVTKSCKEETFRQDNLEERIFYYYIAPKRVKAWERLLSFLRYHQLYRRAVKQLVAEEGTPMLTHVHIALKAGLIARWVKKKYRVPYVLTEHWSVYLEEGTPNFSELSRGERYLFQKVFRRAEAVSAVSAYLGQRLQQLFSLKALKVIPNVVDTGIFYPVAKAPEPAVRFIHISGLEPHKNPEQILEAFALLKEKRRDFHLDIVGPPKKDLTALATRLGLDGWVSFHSERPQAELVKLVQRADALVLYSRFETFGCVLIEAHACGLPVIVSDIASLHENVRAEVNGLFAEKENPAVLAEKLGEFMERRHSFDRDEIAAYAHRNFNYHNVGLRFAQWYKEVLQGQKTGFR